MYDINNIKTAIAIATMLLLSGCTTVMAPDTGDKHTSVLPAVMICLASSCNGTWADRAERAGADVSSSGPVTSKQTSDNKPNIPLSIGPGSPNAILK